MLLVLCRRWPHVSTVLSVFNVGTVNEDGNFDKMNQEFERFEGHLVFVKLLLGVDWFLMFLLKGLGCYCLISLMVVT